MLHLMPGLGKVDCMLHATRVTRGPWRGHDRDSVLVAGMIFNQWVRSVPTPIRYEYTSSIIASPCDRIDIVGFRFRLIDRVRTVFIELAELSSQMVVDRHLRGRG